MDHHKNDVDSVGISTCLVCSNLDSLTELTANSMDTSQADIPSIDKSILKGSTERTSRHKFIGHASGLLTPTEAWLILARTQPVRRRGMDPAGQNELKGKREAEWKGEHTMKAARQG